jgi:hypothetical protein
LGLFLEQAFVMAGLMSKTKSDRRIFVTLAGLMALIALLLFYVVFLRSAPPAPRAAADAVQYLAASDHAQPAGFRFQDVPAWLFVHVALIAAAQVLSLMIALRIARREKIGKQDVKTVQFLCEIPMYLGLFGTLLGVCLTQFLTGSLVAPLAYLTTMSGIILHMFGKLTIWLPLPDEPEAEE